MASSASQLSVISRATLNDSVDLLLTFRLSASTGVNGPLMAVVQQAELDRGGLRQRAARCATSQQCRDGCREKRVFHEVCSISMC